MLVTRMLGPSIGPETTRESGCSGGSGRERPLKVRGDIVEQALGEPQRRSTCAGEEALGGALRQRRRVLLEEVLEVLVLTTNRPRRQFCSTRGSTRPAPGGARPGRVRGDWLIPAAVVRPGIAETLAHPSGHRHAHRVPD